MYTHMCTCACIYIYIYIYIYDIYIYIYIYIYIHAYIHITHGAQPPSDGRVLIRATVATHLSCACAVRPINAQRGVYLNSCIETNSEQIECMVCELRHTVRTKSLS